MYCWVVGMYVKLVWGGDEGERGVEKGLEEVKNVWKGKLLGWVDEVYEKVWEMEGGVVCWKKRGGGLVDEMEGGVEEVKVGGYGEYVGGMREGRELIVMREGGGRMEGGEVV